jgi:ABC-type uncharacterized transport system involved in gliding motility auxiliary subunit
MRVRVRVRVRVVVMRVRMTVRLPLITFFSHSSARFRVALALRVGRILDVIVAAARRAA